jgi:DNA-binding transcriptional regulator YhcF (GntR family)
MKKKNTQTAAETLAAQLESKIAAGIYAPGDKLPAIRDLADECGVTVYFVHRCFKSLEKKGLIELRQGSGAYVVHRKNADDAGHERHIVILSAIDQTGFGYLANVLIGVQNAAMREGCAVTLRKRDYYEFVAPAPPIAEAIGNADGVVLLGEYDYLDLRLPAAIPAVGIEMANTFGGIVSPVSFDPVAAAELAVDYFRRRGRKTVRVFFLDRAPAFRFRAECFRMQWEAFGRVELTPHGLIAPGADLADTGCDTGLLFCGGTYCEKTIVEYRTRTGGELTADFDVLSMDGKSLLAPRYTPVSTIYIDWHAAGAAALYELIRRLDHPGAEARRIYLVPKLDELKR